MKKLLAILVCIGLLSSSLNAISPLRAWKCRPTSPRPDCSQAEKDAARNFFKTATAATLGTLAAVLAAFGITAYQLSKEKEAATKPMTQAEQMQQAAQRGREAQEQLAGLAPLPTKEELEQQAKRAALRKAEETEAQIKRLRGQ